MQPHNRSSEKSRPTPFLGNPSPPRTPAAEFAAVPCDESQVIIVTGPQRGLRFPLDEGILIIGRDPQVDIAIEDESASRRHAQLVV